MVINSYFVVLLLLVAVVTVIHIIAALDTVSYVIKLMH